MSYCLDFPHWIQIAGQWAYDWQTLVAGSLAIFGAFLGAQAVYRQTQQGVDFQEAELRRKHRAEMAVFGLALAQICDNVICAEQGCGRLLQNPSQNPEAIFDGTEKLKISDEVIVRLYEFIKSTDDPRLVGLVSTICHNIQIRLSRQRLEGTRDSTLQLAIAELAGIHAMCESLFPYARGERTEPPTEVMWKQSGSSLLSGGFPIDRFPEVERLLEMYQTSRVHVWSLND